MDIGKVFTDGVVIRERHRPLDEGKVGHLADSMRELGLQQPISIWVEGEGSPVLVAGRHRLEAARKLGWEQIDCVFVGLDETEREMWEIAENLHRVDLSKEQRDAQVRRYAELLLIREQSVIVPQNAEQFEMPERRGRGRPKGIVTKVSEQTGLSDDTVRRALNPAPRAVKIAADPINDLEAKEKQVAALMSAWNRAGIDAREEFIARIDRPAFDNTRSGRAA